MRRLRYPHRFPAPVLALLPLLAACAGEDAAPAPPVSAEAVAAAAETITSDDVIRRIGVMAHDSMLGRDTPSPELEEVAAWIAADFEALGLEPGAGDSFIQRYPLRRMGVDSAAARFVASNGAELLWDADVADLRGLPREVRASGPVVVVSGDGGQEMALTGGLPEDAMVVVFAGKGMEATRSEAWPGRVEGLYAAGAAQVVIVTGMVDEVWERSVARGRAGSRVVGEPDPERTTALYVRHAAAERLLAGTGLDADALHARSDQAARLDTPDGLTLEVNTPVVILDDRSAPNVVGIVRGTDPVLADEYVVYSAHMDHVGVGRPDLDGDSIFNGADDDASGTATVMEVAEAFASLDPGPRRSILFVIVSGEEKGLWGSGYFADHPTVPLESMVANLNADMVGRNWPDTIVAIGKEHSDLGATLARVNEANAELNMTAIDDIWPEQRFYYRSDHFNFARKGVPILFFFNGTHDDYHRPSDEVEQIDGEKTARIGRLLFRLGVEVADADDRPRWDPESYESIVAGG